MPLQDKVAVVSGASRGIGRATALALAARGASVVVVYRQQRDAARAVVDEIRSAGGRAHAFQADVGRANSVRALADVIADEHDRIDILVNNAGVFGARPIGELDSAFFDEQFHNNTLSVMLMTQAFAPLFGAAGGSIVNVSSNLARAPRAETGVYSASKAAVDALTRAFALELGPRRIRVNAVAPFITRTDMTDGIPETRLEHAREKTPLGRLAEPEDIANAIAALVSPDMAWVTGRSLLADGGFTD
ncbi:SDR family NAD(P)-dependent oxidoreductase [Variovorax sp. YR216]|uniref:SDR family NAD(P)-dependent oxidoreductase n=1 Tax=Variovorax sp. YR216 TaxID=1882828 RepID=UPI00089C0217|nr:glucose 1-dehydrogenase [Variovorax sp. YR216]SEA71982.1 3-oxoacyl-[acyl-carrier protein] reductase [Variovorax sp. YR216]